MPDNAPLDPVDRLRDVLAATTADIPKLEAAVAAAQATVASAQERLRRQLTAAEKMREALRLLEADETPATATQLDLPASGVTPQGAPGERVRIFTMDTGDNSKKARMTRAVSDLLNMRGSVHRRVILHHLTDAGIMGHESDPLAHLAAFLSSNRDKFVPDGKGNFTLKPSGTAEPLPAPNGAGSAGVGDTGHTSARPEHKQEATKGGGFYEPAAQR